MAQHSVKITPYYMKYTFYEYRGDGNDAAEDYISYFDTPHELFHEVCHCYAFDDFAGNEMKITEIHCGDETCRYIGWLPGMRYVIEDSHGEVVWDCCYPEWDH